LETFKWCPSLVGVASDANVLRSACTTGDNSIEKKLGL
jgi:hypothetical protein